MIYGYGVSKCDSIRWEVLFYPSEAGGRDRTEKKDRRVIFCEEVRRDF
jgi:hypothetical protein